MLKAIATAPGEDTLYVEMTQEEIDQRLAEEAAWAAEQAADKRTPLEKITEAVKALPVAKRTNPAWGGFVDQCLKAIQYDDSEALAVLLINSVAENPDPEYVGFTTTDADYVATINQARDLFGLM